MAKNTIPRGETSVIRHVFIQDSTSTAGAGQTALAYDTASLTAYYIYPGGTATSLTLETISTLGTYAAPTSAAHIRFKKVDDTNMPGVYELQFHNDWFSVASARKGAVLQMKGATGMAPLNLEIDVIGFDLQAGVAPTGDTYASITGNRDEPGQGSPAASTSILAKIDYLYKSWRNKKTQTSSEWALYDDAGTTKDQEAAVTDADSTTTKDKIQTGA